jgi:putative transposon-encoded protein
MVKKVKTKLQVENIRGFFKKKVTKFGTGAKIDCPKEYLNKEAIVIIK